MRSVRIGGQVLLSKVALPKILDDHLSSSRRQLHPWEIITFSTYRALRRSKTRVLGVSVVVGVDNEAQLDFTQVSCGGSDTPHSRLFFAHWPQTGRFSSHWVVNRTSQSKFMSQRG